MKISQNNHPKNLVARIKEAASKHDIKLPDGWKHKVAQRLVAEWSKSNNVPDELINRSKQLFKSIARCFDKLSQETSVTTSQVTNNQAKEKITEATMVANSSTDNQAAEEGDGSLIVIEAACYRHITIWMLSL